MAARCVTSSSIQQNRFSKLSIQRNARQVQRCVLARGGAVTELNTIEAYKEFIEHDGVASWCAPCKLIAPKIEEMAAELTDVKFGKLNLTETPNVGPFAKALEIKSMPCFHVYKNGGKFDQMTGNNPDGLRKMVISAL
ncbi:hypothetical protein KSW81_007958 [Nannochloris sp. 'desiccata']|nr:hypothetical protein KSW81_007958 [Chlorella desiccata (nom. nud.)]